MRMNKGELAVKGCDNVGEHVQAEGGTAQSRGINHDEDEQDDDGDDAEYDDNMHEDVYLSIL